jgi:peptidoglycan hydrolase-like protein with peptidoglycan-binding domain
MSMHGEARVLAAKALTEVFHTTPTPGEVNHICAVSHIETAHGYGWKGAGKGSNNQGAVQKGSTWRGEVFTYTDTTPIPGTNNSKPYVAYFRKYPTPLDGWIDLVRVGYSYCGRGVVREAAKRDDTYAVSKLLHDTRYYEGFGPTVEDRIQRHYRSMSKAIAIDSEIMVPPIALTNLPSTVRRGYRGHDVAQLQRELQGFRPMAADNFFGPITEQTLLDYQEEHHLVRDGICGPVTWACLFGDDYQPPEMAA